MSKLYDKAAYVLGKSRDEPAKAEKRLTSLAPMLQEGMAVTELVDIRSRIPHKSRLAQSNRNAIEADRFLSR